MNDHDELIRNITYANDKSLEQFDRIKDITKKFYDIPRAPLTIEETYVLRNALMDLQVHVEMTRNDLIRFKRLQTKKSIIAKLMRK